MARTPGSGWGAGPLFWQLCPECSKKKVLYRYVSWQVGDTFYCHQCKKNIDGSKLERKTNK